MTTSRLFKIIPIIVVVIGLAVWYFYSRSQPAKIIYGKAELQVLQARLVEEVKTQNARVAIDHLAELMEHEDAVVAYCHPLMHAIGDVAYEKYRDVATALSYKDDLCSSGYFHGVIENYIAMAPDPEKALRTVCDGETDPSRRESCFHGVGHGLMLLNKNNVPLALDRCEAYPEAKARLRCAEGVFMENFNIDLQIHLSKYLDPNDPLGLCRTQKFPYRKGVCYFYSSLYYLNVHPKEYNAAFAWCVDDAEESFVEYCIKGVAARITKENIKHISVAEDLCLDLPAQYQASCARGIGSYHYAHFNDKERTRAMCFSLREHFKESCLKALD